MRGAAVGQPTGASSTDNFYSRASCEARLMCTMMLFLDIRISTHAPHARRGSDRGTIHSKSMNISIHAPHARRGWTTWNWPEMKRSFLLTRLMRGAARWFKNATLFYAFLLTRLMRGAACLLHRSQRVSAISTHAPHARRG